MKRTFSLLPLLILCSLLLAGCPVKEEITMFNNSGVVITVQLPEGIVEWSPDSTIKIAETGSSVGWESLEWAGDPMKEYIPLLTITDGHQTKTFALVFHKLPSSFISNNGRVDIHLQLDKGMSLYVVPVSSKFPVEDQGVMLPLEVK